MKKFGSMTAAIAATALLAACGGGADEAEPAPADTAAADPAATTAAPAGGEAPAPDNTETTDGTMLANFTGDAAAGEQVFNQCKTCHVTEEGVNRTGPSLHAIVGREAGTVEGFNYTPANANSGITWTKEKLFQYLQNPQRVVPGTKMAFAGLPEAQDRANVIAYLETQGN